MGHSGWLWDGWVVLDYIEGHEEYGVVLMGNRLVPRLHSMVLGCLDYDPGLDGTSGVRPDTGQ
jgi:hypothetical protein